ncbi:MAG: class I SAM-dependent methyltransferase [Pseudomonadota bacterium]
MPQDELPASKTGRVDWVIHAESNAEMRRRYDLWAEKYDSDIGSFSDYLGPQNVADVARSHLDPCAKILDAGAGTGLVGEALKKAGFESLFAADYSPQMLEKARGKGVYHELFLCDLSRQTAFENASFDAVITCGTTSQMPPFALREYCRIVRAEGYIIFAVVTGLWEENGYAAIFEELAAAGRISLKSKGEAFQMMPTTEPDFYCEIWIMKVLQT